MNNQTTNPVFHGSDIEKISACYHIKKEAIVNFAGNVNPLGLPASVKEAVATHADLFSSYPDREYLSLRNVLSNYCDVPADYIRLLHTVRFLQNLFFREMAPVN